MSVDNVNLAVTYKAKRQVGYLAGNFYNAAWNAADYNLVEVDLPATIIAFVGYGFSFADGDSTAGVRAVAKLPDGSLIDRPVSDFTVVSTDLEPTESQA